MRPRLRLAACLVLAGCLACRERVRPDETKNDAQQTATLAPDTPDVDTSVSAYVERYGRDRAATVNEARAAILASGLDSSHTLPLLSRLALSDSIWHSLRPRPDAPDTALPGVLERWFAAAATLPNDRRATAYYGADLLLGVAGFGLFERTPKADSARQRVAALGVDIFWMEAGARFIYSHSLLTKVIALDPNGTSGIAARFWKLEHWCDVDPSGGDFSQKAIDELTQLMRLDLGPRRLALAHFYLAEANRDRVDIARGGDIFTDSAPYVPGEPAARVAAISHYRSSLTLDSTSDQAAMARTELALLVAGGKPENSRFICWRGE